MAQFYSQRTCGTGKLSVLLLELKQTIRGKHYEVSTTFVDEIRKRIVHVSIDKENSTS